MRPSRVRLYDVPLLLGIPVGVVVGLLFGDLVMSIMLGFVFGNFATYALRYQSNALGRRKSGFCFPRKATAPHCCTGRTLGSMGVGAGLSHLGQPPPLDRVEFTAFCR
jgi:hypothetical protein